MTSHQKILISASLTTVAPVSIKLPDVEGHPTLVRGIDADGQPKSTAYIPATTIRGKFRRLAVVPQMLADAAEGKHWDLKQVYESLVGQGDDGKKKAKDAAEDDEGGKDYVDLAGLRKRRADNHFIDLFGAGLDLKSRLSVGHFLPAEGVFITPEKFGVVRKDLDSDQDVLDALTPAVFDQFNARARINSERAAAAALVKDLKMKVRKAKTPEDKEAIQTALTDAEADVQRLLDLQGDMQNSTKTIAGYSAMPAGMELFSRMYIERALPKDLVLLERVINGFSRHPVLGGQVSRGCGEVRGKLEVSDQDGVLLGILSFGGFAAAKVEWTADGAAFIGAAG